MYAKVGVVSSCMYVICACLCLKLDLFMVVFEIYSLPIEYFNICHMVKRLKWNWEFLLYYQPNIYTGVSPNTATKQEAGSCLTISDVAVLRSFIYLFIYFADCTVRARVIWNLSLDRIQANFPLVWSCFRGVLPWYNPFKEVLARSTGVCKVMIDFKPQLRQLGHLLVN